MRGVTKLEEENWNLRIFVPDERLCTITTPPDIMVLNDPDCFHLVIDTVDRRGRDLREIHNWQKGGGNWPAAVRACGNQVIADGPNARRKQLSVDASD
jgi:hypothetical protein